MINSSSLERQVVNGNHDLNYSTYNFNRNSSNSNQFTNLINNRYNINGYSSNNTGYEQNQIPYYSTEQNYIINPVDKYKYQIKMLHQEISRLKTIICTQEEKLIYAITMYENEIDYIKSNNIPFISNVSAQTTLQVSPETYIYHKVQSDLESNFGSGLDIDLESNLEPNLEPNLDTDITTETNLSDNHDSVKSSKRVYKSSTKTYVSKSKSNPNLTNSGNKTPKAKQSKLVCGICQDDKVYKYSIDLKNHRNTHDNLEFISTLPDDMKCVQCVKAFINIKGKHIHEGRHHKKSA